MTYALLRREGPGFEFAAHEEIGPLPTRVPALFDTRAEADHELYFLEDEDVEIAEVLSRRAGRYVLRLADGRQLDLTVDDNGEVNK